MNEEQRWSDLKEWMKKVDQTMDKVAEGLFMIARHDKDIDAANERITKVEDKVSGIEKQLPGLLNLADKWKWIERIVWGALVAALLGLVLVK